MRTTMRVIGLLLVATSAHAQTVVPVPSLPDSLSSLVWDDPSPATSKPDSYRVILDAQPAVTVAATKPTPCTICGTVPFTLTSQGAHMISVVGVKAGFPDSPPAVLNFTVCLLPCGGGPSSVLNLQIIRAEPAPVNDLPPATSLTDGTGAVWTRSATTVTCPNPAWPANQCFNLLRNGVVQRVGYELFLRTSADGQGRTKVIYLHEPGTWYEDHFPNGQWTWGATKPPQ